MTEPLGRPQALAEVEGHSIRAREVDPFPFPPAGRTGKMTEKVFSMEEMGQQSRHQHTTAFMGPIAVSLSPGSCIY